MAENNFRYFEFGEFRLDAHRRTLQKNGAPVHLTPRTFDLLCVMVENAGRVLGHDELLDKVWEGTFVEQSNLKKAVSNLRQALGESPNAAEFITTVPRRGYRFIAEVRPLAAESETILIRETKTEIVVEEEIEDDAPLIVVNPPPAALEGKKSNRRIAIAALAAMLLVAAVTAAWIFFPRRPAQRFPVETVKTTKISADKMATNLIPISADGKYIAYAVFENGSTGLVIKQIATDSTRTIVAPQPNVAFWSYVFSPDGAFVYYLLHDFGDPSKNGLYKIPFLGGATQRIVEKAGVFPTFSPDGKRLAFARVMDDFRTELVTVNAADGSDERRVAIYDEKYRFWGLVWTEDAADLLCTIRRRDDDRTVYYVAEISVSDGAEKIVLPEQEANLISAVWLPGKQSLLFSMSEPNAVVRQIWEFFPASGERRRVTNDNVSYWYLSLTLDGKTLVTVQETRPATIWTANAEDFTDLRQIPVGVKDFWRAFWTADGKIIYHAMENRQEALWLLTADGAGNQRLTTGSDSFDLSPRVTTDGRTLTFASRRSGNSQIWRIDADGKNLRQLTDNLKTTGSEAKLLADAQTLVYSSFQSPHGWTLFKRTPGATDMALTNVTVEAWDVSPDERLIAYSGTDPDTKKNRLYIQSLETGAVVKVFDVRASHTLTWARDGKAIIFGSRRDGAMNEIMIQPLDGSAPKTFIVPEPERIFWLDLSPDGKRLLIVRGKIQAEAVLIRAGEVEH